MIHANKRARNASGKDPDFEQYEVSFRQAYPQVDNRAISECYMRGAAAKAEGVTGIIISPHGEVRPRLEECAVEVSAGYGPQYLVAYMKAEHVARYRGHWPEFLEKARQIEGHPLSGDPRHDARSFILETLISNRHYANNPMAVLAASVIVWLATTSPDGPILGETHTRVHYQIISSGPGLQDLHLMLA